MESNITRMAYSLYETRLQRIVVAVLIKTNIHSKMTTIKFLQASTCVIEGTSHPLDPKYQGLLLSGGAASGSKLNKGVKV